MDSYREFRRAAILAEIKSKEYERDRLNSSLNEYTSMQSKINEGINQLKNAKDYISNGVTLMKDNYKSTTATAKAGELSARMGEIYSYIRNIK